MKQKSDIQRILLVLLGAIVMALNYQNLRSGRRYVPRRLQWSDPADSAHGLGILSPGTALFRHQPAIELHSCCHQLPLYRQKIHRLFLYDDRPFSILTDLFPSLEITSDPLLISIFGGIINGCAISLCLFANATSAAPILSPFSSPSARELIPGTIFSWKCGHAGGGRTALRLGKIPVLHHLPVYLPPRFSICSINGIRNRPC